MNSTQLECFMQVAENLNFARAAEALHITQPSVTHQIHTLEAELNVKLFHRTTRSVSLTQAGLSFFADAKNILSLMKISKMRLHDDSTDKLSFFAMGLHRKMELSQLRDKTSDVVECVDNDETAAVIAGLVDAKVLLIMTSADGIYADPKDPSTLVQEVRAGANGAKAKLEYILPCARKGTTVIIGHARYRISQLLDGQAPCTRFYIP